MKFYPEKLLKKRKKEGLSCSKLSSKIGVGRTTYWKWESGKSIPNENFIRQLAKILNISVREISDLEPAQPISEIDYSDTITSWLSFMDMDFEIFQQKSINEALQKILSLNNELLRASVITRALLKATTSIMYIKDKDLKYMTANDAFLKNLSLTSQYNVLNKTDEDFFSKNEAKLNHEEDKQVFKSGKPLIGLERHIPGSRKRKWGYISKQPILDKNNKISGVIGSFTDITKLKEIERERLVLENAINNLDSYIWIAKYSHEDDTLNILYLSKSVHKAYDIITASKDKNEKIVQLDNNKICKFLSNEHYEFIKKTIKSTETTFPLVHEYTSYSNLYNTERAFNEKVVNYKEDYYIGFLEDITDRKDTEKSLKLLDISIDSMSDAVGIFDIKQNKYIYLNKSLEKITGHPLDKFYKHGREYWLKNCVHPEDKPLQKYYHQNKEWTFKRREYRIIRPNGETRWLEARTFPVSNADIVITILRDITIEKKQKEKQELLKIYMNEVHFGILILDINKRQNIFVNKTMADISGFDISNFRNESGYRFWLNNCVHPEDNPIQEKYYNLKSWPEKNHFRIVRPDGEVRLVEVKTSKYTKYLDQECYIAIIDDITKQTEKNEIFKLLEHTIDHSIDCLSVRQITPYRVIYISKSCEMIFGYKREEFMKDINFRVKTCVHPDDKKNERENHGKIYATSNTQLSNYHS